MNNLTQTLLLLALACTVGLIFASELPGAWWQRLIATLVLLFAAAGCSAAADEEAK